MDIAEEQIHASLPEITLFAYFPHKDIFDFEAETYDDYALFYLTNGAYDYRIEKKEADTATPHTLILCPPHTPFHRRARLTMSLYMLRFRSDDPLPSGKVTSADPARLHDDLTRFRYAGVYPLTGTGDRLTHYLTDAILTLYPPSAVIGSVAARVHDALLQSKNGCPSNRELAELVGYSEVRMCDLFRAAYGVTPRRYYEQRAISRARAYLATTSLSIRDIALSVGYSDPLYFCRIFHRETGASPTAYRRNARL